MQVVPAYGRDYTSIAAARADWEAGKDFVIASIDSPWHGSYVNREDFPVGRVTVHFNKLRLFGELQK